MKSHSLAHLAELVDESGKPHAGALQFSLVDALTDSVSVLLSAGAETQHGWVLIAGVVIDPLLLLALLEAVALDGHTDAVGREDPAADEWLSLEVAVELLVVLLGEGLADGLLVGSDRGLDSDVVSWSLPAEVDLVVVWLPAGVGGTEVLRDVDVDLEASVDGFLDGRETSDIVEADIWGLADGHTAVEAEDEALWDGAVRWGIQLAPGGSAGALAEEWVIDDAVALLDLLGGLDEDLCSPLEWVLAHVWHGAVAGDAADLDLDLHTAALSTVNAETRTSGIASALGDDDEVWDWELVFLDDLVLEVVQWAAAVVVLFLDGADRDDLDALESALLDELEADLGGHHLRDDAGELVSGATSPDAVLVLVLLWNPAEVLLELLAVDLGWVDEALPAVNAADLGPLVWKWSDGIGVAVEVDNLLVIRLVGLVLDDPDKATGAVDEDVLWLGDALVLDDLVLQVVESGALAVGLSGLRVGGDGVLRDTDGLTEPLASEVLVLGSKFLNVLGKSHKLVGGGGDQKKN